MAYYLNVINYAQISDSDGRDNKYKRMLAGKKHYHLGDLNLDGKIILTDVKKIRCEDLTGFIWLKIGTPIVGYCK
jgi:hypothetical protein